MRILSDEEITGLIRELKIISGNPFFRLEAKDKVHYQHKEKELDVMGDNGNLFRIIIRQNKLNIIDFSIILTVREKDSNAEYILLRYNGKHPSPHTNKWEKENKADNPAFYPAFHIHRATYRYQEAGYKIDGYAEVTTKYSDFRSALSQFLLECNIQQEDTGQASLFEGGILK